MSEYDLNGIAEFLRIADKCSSFPMFKMQTAIEGRAELTSKDFYSKCISSLASAAEVKLADKQLERMLGVNAQALIDYLASRISRIPWFKEYSDSF